MSYVFNSLRIRMFVVIVLLAVIPQLVVAIIVGQRSSNALEQQALVLQRRVVANVRDEINAYIQEHKNQLVFLDEVNGLGTLDTEVQVTILKNVLDSQRVFHELTLVDRGGQELIYLSRTDVVLDSELTSRADNPEFLGPIRRGEAYFGSVNFDEAIREPLMMISVPLFDQRKGEIAAVLIASLRFKPVWDLLAGMALPNGGDAYVLNQTGRIVAHKSPDTVLRSRTINLMAKEGRGMGLNETDVFFSSQALDFGEQELLIIAEQPAWSALELAETNSRVYMAIVALSVTAAIGLAVMASRQIVRPVEQLAVATRAMAKGDFSIRVEHSGKDEIGSLAGAFNAMNAELQRLVSSLKQEVIERRQAETALQKANERLQELDRMKAKFIDDLSHELRTPLSNINLYLDLLTRGKPENHARYETVLRKESDRLVSLTNGILDFSNLQENLDKAILTSVDINALVAKVVVDFEQLALTHDLNLSFSQSAETLNVMGNAEKLEHVVTNLLKNAINYTLSGHVHLSTHQTSKGDLIRLTIEDSGIGLDEEELNHCFERFYRGKRVGQYNIVPGAGLGLTQVSDIVAFHKGWIEVESEIEQGSTFSVYLPAHKGNDQKKSGSLHVSRE